MSDELLRELGTELPWDRPDAERREAVRSALLVAATAEVAAPPRRWVFAGAGFAAGVLAAAAVAVVITRPTRETLATPQATLTSSAAANLEHTFAPSPTGTDETVRIHSGTVRLAVPSVRAGDHVRARTGDATVEGAGDYEVVVVADALSAVTVRSGSATIAVHGQSVFLAAGEAWHATVTTADLTPPSRAGDRSGSDGVDPRDLDQPEAPPLAAPPSREATPRSNAASPGRDASTAGPPARGIAPRPVPDPPTARAPSIEPVPPPRDPAITAPAAPPSAPPANGGAVRATPTPALATAPTTTATERHFKLGWALLRSGKAREAAVELGTAADGGSDEPLAADARYFQAIALTRTGDAAAAERALVAFLDHAPGSLRRGRAAVMLGRLIADRGDTATARTWFDTATHDPDAEVAAAARAGLAALGH